MFHGNWPSEWMKKRTLDQQCRNLAEIKQRGQPSMSILHKAGPVAPAHSFPNQYLSSFSNDIDMEETACHVAAMSQHHSLWSAPKALML